MQTIKTILDGGQVTVDPVLDRVILQVTGNLMFGFNNNYIILIKNIEIKQYVFFFIFIQLKFGHK